MFAEQDEGADIPAHDKHGDGCTHQCGTDRIDISQIFRGQVKRISAECIHEAAVDNRKQNKPKHQQYLVFPKVQEQQLNRK